jgi:hypothetical protein
MSTYVDTAGNFSVDTQERPQPRTSGTVRIARPIFCRTLTSDSTQYADTAANQFSERVANEGGEVLGIQAYREVDVSGDRATTYHHRVVTYKAVRPLALE